MNKNIELFTRVYLKPFIEGMKQVYKLNDNEAQVKTCDIILQEIDNLAKLVPEVE